MSMFDSNRISLPPVVKNIIIINVIVFAITALTESMLQTDFMVRHFALFPVGSSLFQPYQVVTHMFMHANLMHIFFNMFGVFMFGRMLEQIWGSKRLLIFYTVTGLGAAAAQLTVTYFQTHHMLQLVNQFNADPSYTVFNDIINRYFIGGNPPELINFMQQWFYHPDNVSYVPEARQWLEIAVQRNMMMPTVGASGAVFGILIAFAMMFPDVELMFIFLPIPVKAKYMVPFYALLELVLGVAGFKWDNVAHFAHLGGALFGFILVRIWKRNQFRIY
jgi:membrane associated rhomboid family serine protease